MTLLLPLLLVASTSTATPSLMAALELRPAPRLGATYEHALSPALSLSEALTVGLGSFPDVELRIALHAEALDPIAPWIALRVRRIDLEGLPPVENYLQLGLSARTDPNATISATGGVGLRLQIPPLAVEAARDAGAYFAENVALEVHFALRLRIL